MVDPFSPARLLPARPNLDHLRVQAKALLDAALSGDAASIARLNAVPTAPATPPLLADAQFALAREYGFPSWPRLVAHVEALNAARSAPDPADHERIVKLFRAAVNDNHVDALRPLLANEPLARALVNAPIFDFGARPLSRGKRDDAMTDLLIAHGADVNAKSDWALGGWGLLDDADEATARRLIARGAIVDIFAAAHLDDLPRLIELLDADPSLVHAKGGDGCRPLHYALTEAAIDLLLSRGAEIDARDDDHTSTAAQWALPRPPDERGAGNPPRALTRVRWLVDRGATVDIFMAASLRDARRLAAMLDADPRSIDARVNMPGYAPCPVGPGGHIYTFSLIAGRSPLQIAHAAGNAECLRLLLDRSTPQQRFLAACTTGDEAAARDALARDPTLMSTMTPSEQRALPDAAWAGDAAAVRLMLDLGFELLAQGPDTGTALHCAAWHGRPQIVAMILNHPRVRAELSRVVQAIEPTHNGTPLGWCCHGSLYGRNASGDYGEVARQLLMHGAVPSDLTSHAAPDVREAMAQFGL